MKLLTICKVAVFSILISAIAAAPIWSQDRKALGLEETPEQLEKSLRFAASKPGIGELPPKVDLTPLFPTPGDQGNIGSCTAWATGYAAKSFQENAEWQWGLREDSSLFSPSYIYNQINKGRDQGSAIVDAVTLLVEQGCATMRTMPYTENYRQRPNQAARQEAARYKADSYARIDWRDRNAMKTVLAGENCILVGMNVYENFMSYSGGIYNRTRGVFMGGHAMAVIGYDDDKQAYKLINSWSTHWGENGYGWVDYGTFETLNETAIVMYDKIINTPVESLPPNNVEASQASYTDRVLVTWNAVDNAGSYLVYRAMGQARDFQKIGHVRGTAFYDRHVQAGKKYYYSISSNGPGGPSSPSSVAEGWVERVLQKPGQPQALKAIVGESQILLRWAAVEAAAAYNVYRWDRAVEEYVKIGSSDNEGFSYRDYSKDPHVERFVVTAVNDSEESAASTPVTVTVTTDDTDAIVLPPETVRASQGNYLREIRIEWSLVEGAEKYGVFGWSDRDRRWILLQATNLTTYIDRNIQGKSREYAVVTKKDGLYSEPSEFVTGWIEGYTPPKAIAVDDVEYFDYFNDDDDNFFSDEKFFSDDSFFTDSKTFFRDFKEEQDFFFDDPEVFFSFDEEEFFKVNDSFFEDNSDFFNN